MNQIPSMWREELFHPQIIHFPIALLFIGTIFYVNGVIGNKNSKLAFLLPSGRLLVLIGVLGAWAAVYTGNMADAVVSRDICDPTVLKDHENFAYTLSYIFSAGIVLDLLGTLILKKEKLVKTLKIIVLVLFLTGSGILMYVGHLGGKLVYQQSAAVYTPSEDCSEFE
jgi:uncharacterized membrane protein